MYGRRFNFLNFDSFGRLLCVGLIVTIFSQLFSRFLERFQVASRSSLPSETSKDGDLDALDRVRFHLRPTDFPFETARSRRDSEEGEARSSSSALSAASICWWMLVSLRRINPKIARSSYECLTIALHRKRKHHDLSNDLSIFYIVCSHIKKFYEFFSLPPPDLHEIDGFFVSIFLYTSSYTSLYPFILHEN